jgi:hypothetical protein
MKFVSAKPLSNLKTAARKLIEIANGVEAVQDSPIHIEKVNGPFLFRSWERPINTGLGRSMRLSLAGSCCTRAARI